MLNRYYYKTDKQKEQYFVKKVEMKVIGEVRQSEFIENSNGAV